MEVMDRELSPAYKQKRIQRLLITISIVALGAVGAFASFRSLLTPTLERSNFTTAIAEIGPVEATLTASGVILPEYEQLITSPITARIEKVIHHAGEAVKAGESIIQLNKESTLIEYDQLKDEQEVNQNKISQLRLSLEKSLNDLQTQYSIKELQIKSLETALVHEKSLLKIGGSTTENVKQAELTLRIAQLELKQLSKLIQNQQQTMQADLRSLGFQINIQEKNIQELSRRLQQAEIQATQNGVITWVNDDIGSTINEGGELVRIADLSSFKVEGSISDSYASQLKPGGPVIVRINDKDLRGNITHIKPQVDNGIVKFMIRLDKKNHALLRSNAKVDVFVVTAFKAQVIRVKNGPGFNGSAEQKVFVVKGSEAIVRTVKVGESNLDYLEIKSGLQAGEEIIITDMQEYNQQEKVVIQ